MEDANADNPTIAEMVEMGLDRRTANYVGFAKQMIEVCKEIKELQSRFLDEEGMTWDEARALDKDGRDALQSRYADWLAAQEPQAPGM